MTLKPWIAAFAAAALVTAWGGPAPADVGVLVGGGAASLDAPDLGSAPLDYDAAESGGEVQPDSAVQADGSITGFRDGMRFASVGDVALLSWERGRALKPGQECVAYEDEGELGQGVPGAGASGTLLSNCGVLRVLTSSHGAATALVIKLYRSLAVGDAVRSRAARREAYERLLDRRAPAVRLEGVVVGMLPPELWASSGDFVYLDVGWKGGALPGVRLTVISDPDSLTGKFGADDDSSPEPKAPLDAMAPADEVSRALDNGAIADLEVLNASRDACVARVLNCESPVNLGDTVVRARP